MPGSGRERRGENRRIVCLGLSRWYSVHRAHRSLPHELEWVRQRIDQLLGSERRQRARRYVDLYEVKLDLNIVPVVGHSMNGLATAAEGRRNLDVLVPGPTVTRAPQTHGRKHRPAGNLTE